MPDELENEGVPPMLIRVPFMPPLKREAEISERLLKLHETAMQPKLSYVARGWEGGGSTTANCGQRLSSIMRPAPLQYHRRRLSPSHRFRVPAIPPRPNPRTVPQVHEGPSRLDTTRAYPHTGLHRFLANLPASSCRVRVLFRISEK